MRDRVKTKRPKLDLKKVNAAARRLKPISKRQQNILLYGMPIRWVTLKEFKKIYPPRKKKK